MRWMPAFLLCGCLALLAAVALQPPHSVAMQASPTPPSDPARAFCPDDEKIPVDDVSIFDPAAETVGAASVTDIANSNPDPAASDSGKLLLTFVTLPQHSCILGSYFFPAAVISVRSGSIDIFIEHWPGAAAAPEAFVRKKDANMSEDLPIATASTISEGDWAKIENESFVGFRNQGDSEATFVVAGLKPNGDPGGGGCGGGCRGKP